ncbi:MAG: hypothetical protein LH606_09325 [Cytophagaceae bacterium]|nr:hypothetical protein [Cytophagaceae bacterium]
MKLVRYALLLMALIAFLGGCSRSVYVSLAELGMVPDDFRYGDLYRLANLPQFKQEREICPPGGRDQPQRPVALYVIGDSFLEPGRMDSSDFVAQTYHYSHWDNPATVKLDTGLHTILLLETVERHAREHFAKPADQLTIVEKVPPSAANESGLLTDLGTFFTGENETRQRLPEEQLENLLFNNSLWLNLKEWKAALTLRWFDRTNPKVALSGDRQHLFYVLDTDSTLIHSSFNHLPYAEVNSLVAHINQTALRYRKLGFDEVWLSIIPNKTSVVEPQRGAYNRLIERVQTAPGLTPEVIDAYRLLKPGRAANYERSDSHWNCRGRALWLSEVNARLSRGVK